MQRCVPGLSMPVMKPKRPLSMHKHTHPHAQSHRPTGWQLGNKKTVMSELLFLTRKGLFLTINAETAQLHVSH